MNISSERKTHVSFVLPRQKVLKFRRTDAAEFRKCCSQAWIASDHMSTDKVMEQRFQTDISYHCWGIIYLY